MGNSMAVLEHLKESRFKPNSIIFITGASSGIGEELSYQYALRKVRLFICARSLDKLKAVAEKCTALGSECAYTSCDVSKEEDVKRAIQECVNKFGGIDLLVVNAGINAHVWFEEVKDLSVYERLMKTNFYGYLYPTKYAFDHLKKNKGQILVISSASGEVGIPMRTAYCASKFAVTGFFESLRIETEDSGVAITIVCPPSVETSMREKDEFIKQHAENSDHKPEKRMPVEECVRNVMIAADRRARKVYFPFGVYMGNYIRPFIPWPVDKTIKKKSKL